MLESIDWSYHYYLSNNIWYYGNILFIPPFIIACVNRYLHPQINKHLWTDHLARFFLFLSWSYYWYDIPIKYVVDGGDNIC
jgi:hypothetical protein